MSKQKKTNLFIIGSGFTKAFWDSAPLNDEFLEKFREELKKDPNNSENGALLQIIDKYKSCYPSIELLLTAYELREGKDDKNYKQNRKIFEREIAKYFTQFRFGNWSRSNSHKITSATIAGIFSSAPCTILSLNYDCFLEGLLDDNEIWTPKRGGYFNIYNPCDTDIKDSKDIEILKIHGSENFRKNTVVAAGGTNVSLELNAEIYPVSCEYMKCKAGIDSPIEGYTSEEIIIAPSYIKKLPTELASQLLRAIMVAQEVSNLIIIGCGMRAEDTYLGLLLQSFAEYSSSGRIIVVEKESSIKESVADRIKKDMPSTIEVIPIIGSISDEEIISKLIDTLEENLNK